MATKKKPALKKGDEGLPLTPKRPGYGDEGLPLKKGGKGTGDEGKPLAAKKKPLPKTKK